MKHAYWIVPLVIVGFIASFPIRDATTLNKVKAESHDAITELKAQEYYTGLTKDGCVMSSDLRHVCSHGAMIHIDSVTSKLDAAGWEVSSGSSYINAKYPDCKLTAESYTKPAGYHLSCTIIWN